MESEIQSSTGDRAVFKVHSLFSYIGIPVGANMTLKRNWRPIIDKFQSSLSIWKAKTLSLGGRLTLIK